MSIVCTKQREKCKETLKRGVHEYHMHKKEGHSGRERQFVVIKQQHNDKTLLLYFFLRFQALL